MVARSSKPSAMRSSSNTEMSPTQMRKNKRDLNQLFIEFVIPIVGREGITVDDSGTVRKQTPELRSSLVKEIRFRRRENRPDILYREFDGGKEDGNGPQHRSLLDRFNNFRMSFFTK